MDLTSLTGLGPARRDKLANAGIDDLSELAEADPEALAKDVEIPRATIADLVEQAQDLRELTDAGIDEGDLDKLVEAGIRSKDDLLAEGTDDLAAAAGVSAERARSWQKALSSSKAQQAAEQALEGVEPDKPGVVESAQRMQEGALEASDAFAERLTEARVVLEEGITDARVKLEEDVLAEARILPLKAQEDAEELMEEIQGNVVVLREAADDALVRVEGQIQEGLPIFKQKLDEASEQAEEVRVQVEEIRDKRVMPKAESLKQRVKDLLGMD